MTKNGVEWTYTYSNTGLRTSRSNGTTTYKYVYDGSVLKQMTIVNENDHTEKIVGFTYDATGSPLTMTYDGATYYYITNMQGDVVGLLDSAGNRMISYQYTAYGRGYIINNESSMTTILSTVNPIGYRGYVMDVGTATYYCQSRYYDPAIGRFLNADTYPATGQGLTGNNMFAYCGNDPINRQDDVGEWWNVVIGAVVGAVVSAATTAINGGSGKEIALSAVCGLVSGGFAASGIGGVVGQMAVGAITSAIDSGYQNYNAYKSGKKTLGEAIGGTIVDTTLGAAFGAMGAEGTDALKTSNKVASTYKQAKKILKTKGLHPNVKATANAAVNAGKSYLKKTIKNTFLDSLLSTGASTAMSKLGEKHISAIF